MPYNCMIHGLSYNDHCPKCKKKEQLKMTREEAVKKCYGIAYPETIVQALEALGLLKFEEEKCLLNYGSTYTRNNGIIQLEEWPEGLVLWVGGKIVWKSWERFVTGDLDPIKIGDHVRIELASHSHFTGPVQIYDGLLRSIKKKGA